jgi:cobalamin biosynthesis protein CobT
VTEERKEQDRKAEEEESQKALEAAESESEAEESEEGEEEEEEAEESGSDKPGRSQTKLWIAIGIGVVLAVLLVMKRGGNADSPGGDVSVGSTTSGDLTLVAADRNELECAAQKGVDAYQCGFADENQARSVEEGKKLRPFMTIDRHLYLIPGLFTEKAIDQRYNAEPPSKPRGEQKRFTAKCKIKVVGELDGVKLRWSPTGTWEPPKKVPVATVSDCAIEG